MSGKMKIDPESYAIIGAAMQVHSALGPGFLEAVYQKALEIEFQLSNVPYEREKKIEISYKDRKLGLYYKADFVCYGDIIIELKAINKLGDKEEAQLINYLRALSLHRGLLLNFGARSLEYKRRVL